LHPTSTIAYFKFASAFSAGILISSVLDYIVFKTALIDCCDLWSIDLHIKGKASPGRRLSTELYKMSKEREKIAAPSSLNEWANQWTSTAEQISREDKKLLEQSITKGKKCKSSRFGCNGR